MARVLSFLIRYFSNYYTLHRSNLAARAAPLDPRLNILTIKNVKRWYEEKIYATNVNTITNNVVLKSTVVLFIKQKDSITCLSVIESVTYSKMK